MNKIENVSIRAFETPQDADKYFAMKNVLAGAEARFNNASFYSGVICNDLKALLPNVHNCSFNFSESYKASLMKTYNFTQDDFNVDVANDNSYS